MRGLLFLSIAATALAQPPQLVKVAGGFANPVHIATPGDGSNRLFVVEQRGRILSGGAVILDITSRVSCCGERGLLSVAFPPDFARKNYFYVYYTNLAGDITVSRFRGASEEILLTAPHRQYTNHNGGGMVFGPDGYLYIGVGDGGGAGDPLANGQNTNSLLGKLLRIDVESGAVPYAVPPANPFASQSGYRPEIWAYGLRNPWRFSFDRANGDLYIGDVGQDTYEEIDYQPAADRGGENYGWNIMEGFHCFRPACSAAGLTLPVAEYTHTNGACSITGGFVYRGSRVPALQGAYIYGDYCSGRIWTLRRQGGQWQTAVLMDAGFSIATFGQDDAGELYVADYAHGDIYRFDSAAPAITSASVVNSASYDAAISPGSLVTVFGTNFMPPDGIVNASTLPLHSELNGVRVLVNGVAAPLLAVANTGTGTEQVNFQMPWDAPPGRSSIQVVRAGVESQTVDVDVSIAAPGLFTVTLPAAGFAAASLADYRSLNCAPAADCPAAHPGDIVLLYATGLGPVANTPATGAAAPDAPLSPALLNVAVTVGGKTAAVDFAGLAPRFVGLWQLNIRVAPDTPPGDNDVVLTVNNVASKPAKLRIH